MELGTLDHPNDHPGDLGGAAPAVMPQRSVAPIGADDRGRLGMRPDRIVSSSLRNRKRWIALAGAATLVIHAGFAAFFLLVMDFRELDDMPEKAIPVEVVTSMPTVPEPKPPPPRLSAGPGPKRDPVPEPPPPTDAPAPPPFVAPPPEALHARAKPLDDKPANAVPEVLKPDDATPRPSPPPAAPKVLTAQGGSFSVSPAAPTPPSPSTAPSTQSRDAVAAKLAEALPQDFSALPSTFRAVLSSQGAEISFEYKGVVYGRLQRSHQASEEARVRHLHGYVVVSFTIDDHGRASDLKVAGSSGTPEVDALGLAMVREAEPFPLPPPGANQVFTPGLIVGDE